MEKLADRTDISWHFSYRESRPPSSSYLLMNLMWLNRWARIHKIFSSPTGDELFGGTFPSPEPQRIMVDLGPVRRASSVNSSYQNEVFY